MMIAGCVDGEPLENELESEATVYAWSDDVPISGQRTDHQVGLARFGTALHMAYNAGGGVLRWARFDGTSWTTAASMPGSVDYGPALVAFNNRLYAIYKAQSQNRLMVTSTTGNTWSTPATAGSTIGSGTILSAPSAVVHGGVLYTGYCTRTPAGDRVRIDRFDGATWQLVADYEAVFRCQNVALASHPDGVFDILFDVVSGYSGNRYMYEIRGTGAPVPSWQRRFLPMTSAKPMSVVTCNGITHLVHGGNATPREIWWTVRENGEWLGDTRVPNQASYGGSALGCFGTQTIMVHNGGYPDLWWARYEE